MNIELTKEELNMLSDSLITAIGNCNTAITLVTSLKAKLAIEENRKSLSELNSKICDEIKKGA